MFDIKTALQDFLMVSLAFHNPKYSGLSGYQELEILDSIYEQKKTALITAISSELGLKTEEARDKLYDLLELVDESKFPDKDYGKLIASITSIQFSGLVSYQIEPNTANFRYLKEITETQLIEFLEYLSRK